MKTMDEARLSERKEVLRDFFGGADAEQLSDEIIRNQFQFEELMLKYRCAIREVTTKLEVLNDELSSSLAHNPIESIQSRIKRPYSIARKLNDLGRPGTVESIAQNLNDVAGIRVICPFINDIYDVAEVLLRQDDVVLISKKDYIRSPKPSGYRSLHLIIEIPVFFSTQKESIRVEIQIRTVAMDFWASLEHQLYYKSRSAVDADIARELYLCAETIAQTDQKMQELRDRIEDEKNKG